MERTPKQVKEVVARSLAKLKAMQQSVGDRAPTEAELRQCLGWDSDLVERVFFVEVEDAQDPPPIPLSVFAEAVEEQLLREKQACPSHLW